MTVTVARLLCVAAIIVLAVVGATVQNPFESCTGGGLLAVVIGLPGIVLIWYRAAPAETAAFARGVLRPSHPALVATFGWLYLLGLAVLFLFIARLRPVSWPWMTNWRSGFVVCPD